MAQITEYECMYCGLELADDGRSFYYDDESGQTVDFLLLMSTVGCDEGSRIRGRAGETYCGDCGKYLKVYVIEECAGDISNPRELVMEGIRNRVEEYQRKIAQLKEIRENPDYTFERDESGFYILKVPGFNHFQYSNLLNPEWSEKRARKCLFDEFHERIGKSIRHYEGLCDRHSDSIYLILDKSAGSEYDCGSLEKVHCPQCGREINMNFHHGMACPRCGFSMTGFPIDAD